MGQQKELMAESCCITSASKCLVRVALTYKVQTGAAASGAAELRRCQEIVGVEWAALEQCCPGLALFPMLRRACAELA